MHKSLITTIIAGIAITLGMMACNKNVYDEKIHEELIHYYSKVDSVDQQHMWQLSQDKTLRFQVPSGSSYKQLRVYTANPLTDSNAELMSQIYVSSGKSGSLTVNVPYQLSTIYAALVDASGLLYVSSLPTSSSPLSIDFTDVTKGVAITSHKPQTYTYLFEENYPEAGDYDYNDIVLRVSQHN